MSAVARPAITGAAVLNENAANGSGKRLQALNHGLGYDDPIFELMNRGAIEIGYHPAGFDEAGLGNESLAHLVDVMGRFHEAGPI